MKKLLVSALIGLTALVGVSSVAQADPYSPYGYAGGYYGYPGGHHHHHRGTGYGYGGYGSHGNIDWVAPALIGGIIGYQLAQPRYVAPPPTVIYQQSPRIIPGPTQIPPVGYHYEDFYDGACNCYRVTLVRNY